MRPGLFPRVMRWAYFAWVGLGLLYFPARVGFRLAPRACEGLVPLSLVLFSFTNYAHIVMFAVFFVISTVQFRASERRTALLYAGLATLVMGALVEIAEGLSGVGHCRLRDLVPDSAGALLGAVAVLLWVTIRERLRVGATQQR